jgi:hypothetical protein
VRVLVPFPPWRLLMTARGLNVSQSGFAAFLEPPPGTDPYADDRGVLLVEGDTFDVQLEDESVDAPTPMLPARLVRREPTPAGLTLGFEFQQPTAELMAFVHDLTARGVRP